MAAAALAVTMNERRVMDMWWPTCGGIDEKMREVVEAASPRWQAFFALRDGWRVLPRHRDGSCAGVMAPGRNPTDRCYRKPLKILFGL